jgi:hypothetical protein
MARSSTAHVVTTTRTYDGISALKRAAIGMLIEDKHVQPELAMNAICLSSPTSTIQANASSLPQLQFAELRAHKREDMLQPTEKDLERIASRVQAGRLAGQDAIG